MAESATHPTILTVDQHQRFDAPVDVYLDRSSEVQPDLVYVSRERKNLLSARGVEGAPDLIAEDFSAFTCGRDLGLEQQMYSRSGVRHHRVVDSEVETLVEYQLRRDAYAVVATDDKCECSEAQLLSNSQFPLQEVFK
jgi:Uma2 family endonuclease